MLPPDSPQKKLVDSVSELLHAGQKFEAAKLVKRWVEQLQGKPFDKQITSESDAYQFLNILLHWCLDNGGAEEAAQMLWGNLQFDPRPESTQRIWKSFDREQFILLMGAGSMSKSFSIGVRLLLEWIRDPEHTMVKLIGPSEQHLEDNLFSHLVTLHRNSTIPLPGVIDKLFIGTDRKQRKGSISGIVVPLGKRAAGRLQGVKRLPRMKPHPKFGKLMRMFVFLDEIANIPLGIWRDIDNVMTTVQGENDQGLKIIGAFNPTDIGDAVGIRCEPELIGEGGASGGWPLFDPDQHFEWKSKRGWWIVRLDAAQCENVRTGQIIFAGLQTKEGFEAIIRNSGGTNSSGYWAMCRGCFPPLGTTMSIIPQGMLTDFKIEVVWFQTPRPCGGVDLALEGGDSAKFALGKWGLASGIKFPPSLKNPNGLTVYFKQGSFVTPRYLLLVEQIFPLEKGDTVAMKESIVHICQTTGVTPEWLCVDRTGNGQGVYDLLRYDWGVGVIGVNYSEDASETKVMVEDSGTAKELYNRAHTELLFAVRKFIEFGYLRGALALDTLELFQQLTGRLFRGNGKTARAETKTDYKSRHAGKSPDDGDSLGLLVHAVRKASGVVLGMTADATRGGEDEGDYLGDEPRVDITNQFEDL